MSQLNVDTIKNRLGTAGPTLPSLSVTNNATVGGGGGESPDGYTSGNGGSGVVLVKYKIPLSSV